MKKIWKGAVALTAASMLILTGCSTPNGGSSSGEDDGRLRIGLSINDTTSFFHEGKQALQAYADENNVELIINDPKGDVSTQATQIDQFVRDGVDGIMVIAIAADSLVPQVQAATDAGIPFMNVNAALNAETTVSLEPDDVQAGRDIANLMAEELGGKGNVVVLQGPLANSAQILRDQGIHEALAEFPDIEIVASDAANWGRDIAANKMANWLTAYGDDIDGVLAHNDDMALGALQALREANRTLPVVGIDGIEDGLRAVDSGEMLGTVLQNGSVELPLGLAFMIQVIEGTNTVDRIDFAMPLVTLDNIELYLKHVVTEKDDFVKDISELIDKNLESGDYSNEEL